MGGRRIGGGLGRGGVSDDDIGGDIKKGGYGEEGLSIRCCGMYNCVVGREGLWGERNGGVWGGGG